MGNELRSGAKVDEGQAHFQRRSSCADTSSFEHEHALILLCLMLYGRGQSKDHYKSIAQAEVGTEAWLPLPSSRLHYIFSHTNINPWHSAPKIIALPFEKEMEAKL